MKCFEMISAKLSNELEVCKLYIDSATLFESHEDTTHAFESLEKIQVLKQMCEQLNKGLPWTDIRKLSNTNRPPDLYELSIIAKCNDLVRYEILKADQIQIEDKPRYIRFLNTFNDEITSLHVTREMLHLYPFQQIDYVKKILSAAWTNLMDLQYVLSIMNVSKNVIDAMEFYLNNILELKKTESGNIGVSVLINGEEKEVWV